MSRPRLRVLSVADVSPLQRSGGSARVVREQALGLLRRGHSVTFLCREPRETVPSETELGGARIFHYPVSRAHPLAYAMTSLLRARRTYRRLLERQSWDAFIFHQPFSALGVQSALAAQGTRVYCFYSPAGIEYRLRAGHPEISRRMPATDLVGALLTRLERRALNRVQVIVVLSEFSRRTLEEIHGRVKPKTVTIPGGVDLQHFRPAADRTSLMAELGIPRRPFLLTVRDLEPRMGIDVLLGALASMHEAQRPYCVIGGSGPLRTVLERQSEGLGLANTVRFAGHIPEEVLPRYYQAADLFVLPTRAQEGFGLVTVEALACGTPVVGTPIGATPEILGGLDSRLLASDGTTESLAYSIEQALVLSDMPDFRSRCRAYAEREYSWDRYVAALEDEILARRPEIESRRPSPEDR